MATTDRLDRIKDPSTWADLCPGLTVGATGADWSWSPNTGTVEHLAASLRTEGYFRAEGVVPPSRATALVSAIATLRQRALPPVFLFVFDEVWTIVPRMRPLLSEILGPDHQVLPSLWAWWLDPGGSDAGWRPHRDRDINTVDEAGHPQTLTLWAALTDATPDNGCIYALPAPRDPHYRVRPRICSVDNLPDIRALPATAGTVLGWNHALLHWGARSNPQARQPRVSLAFELTRADAPQMETPRLPPDTAPDFALRLQLIGTQMLKYQHMHPLSDALEELATALARGA